MADLFRAWQILLSKLTLEQIAALTDEEIKSIAMERPGHDGQLGFLLMPQDFESHDQMGEILHALLSRLSNK